MNIDPWLEPAWYRFQQLVMQQKVPHAILLSGPSGMGKKAFAQKMAQLMLCQSPFNQMACGQCRACQLEQQQSHPDLFTLGETQEGISIEDIRALTVYLRQTAHQKGFKIVILCDVDRLLPSAANALLKTLEEPPDKSLLILTTQQPKKLLLTLKSRCLFFPLPLPSRKMALEWLHAQHPEQTLVDLQLVLASVQGSPRQAHLFLQEDPIAILKKVLEALLFCRPDILIQDDIQQFLTRYAQETLYSLYYWLGEFLRYILQGSTQGQCRDLNRQWAALAQQVGPRQIFFFLEQVHHAMDSLTLPGIHKALVIEALAYAKRDSRVKNGLGTT